MRRNLAGRQPGGNHCHLNIVAVEEGAAAVTKDAFIAAAKRAGFEWEVELPPAEASGDAGRRGLLDAVCKFARNLCLCSHGEFLHRKTLCPAGWARGVLRGDAP